MKSPLFVTLAMRDSYPPSLIKVICFFGEGGGGSSLEYARHVRGRGLLTSYAAAPKETKKLCAGP